MIPDKVLKIIHQLESEENKNLALQWYSYIINTKEYIEPKRFKELELECGVKDFPQNPYSYEILGNHINNYLNYWFYTGDKSLKSPLSVVRKAKSWTEDNVPKDYNIMLTEVRSIEYLYSQITKIDWSHASDFNRRKVLAWTNINLKKKYKDTYKEYLQNKLLILQKFSKKLKVNSNLTDNDLEEIIL